MEKQKGENLGVVIVESGWGSILPTVILASMLNSGPAARSGRLSVGDQIMSINETSLVGLPLATCQGIIKVRSIKHLRLSHIQCSFVLQRRYHNINNVLLVRNTTQADYFFSCGFRAVVIFSRNMYVGTNQKELLPSCFEYLFEH